MDAKQLISLFDAHPKAFALIGVRRSERPDGGLFNFDAMELLPWAEAGTAIAQQWVKWVYGACVLEFVRRQWELPLMWRSNGVVSWHINDGHEISHQTPLLAMLAMIEAEVTDGVATPEEAGRFRVMLNDSSDEHFPDWLFQRSFQTEEEANAWAQEQMKTGRWFGWEVIDATKGAGHG